MPATPTPGGCGATFSAVRYLWGRRPALRVLRGGSWNNRPNNDRSANRNRNTPDNRNNNTGFRVASTAIRARPEPGHDRNRSIYGSRRARRRAVHDRRSGVGGAAMRHRPNDKAARRVW
ncbi:MAG: SUMF1/EgtB/PvdO family nonheme iron enzyme [Thermoguttaceae bacterium]